MEWDDADDTAKDDLNSLYTNRVCCCCCLLLFVFFGVGEGPSQRLFAKVILFALVNPPPFISLTLTRARYRPMWRWPLDAAAWAAWTTASRRKTRRSMTRSFRSAERKPRFAIFEIVWGQKRGGEWGGAGFMLTDRRCVVALDKMGCG